MVGQTISHYRITEKLGEGGMGVVYKAEDTKLDRTVALKFLAAHLLNDDEAKQRFLREAKAAATLSHPNICTVFEIDEADGKTFLAMEFVKGDTLEDHIAKGPLPLKDALDVGRQIAEGLEAAHEAGIVHRDIKPANILIDPKGRATIMDFGLARLTEASRLTKGDQTMGTVAYMSPEQVQGMAVDHRSDIWALGCVLYEMVCGQRPFKGQYDQALAYEIVNQQPEPLTGVRAGVSMELEFVVGKCLAKDAHDRYQHAGELNVDLRTVGEKVKSGASLVRPATTLMPGALTSRASASGSRKHSHHLAWILFAVAALVLAGLGYVHFTESPHRHRVRKFTLVPKDFGGPEGRPAISPDGRYVAYIAGSPEGTLWLDDLARGESRELPGTVGSKRPFWAPNSASISYLQGRDLKRFDLESSSSLTILTLPNESPLFEGAWSPDGDTIVFRPENFSRMLRVSASGGSATPIGPEGSSQMNVGNPYFLPDVGRNLLLYSIGSPSYGELFVYDLDNDETLALGISGAAPVYSPTGHLLYMEGSSNWVGTLWATPFDLESVSLRGNPFIVAEHVGWPTVDAEGTLAYRFDAGGRRVQLVWKDRTGETIDRIPKTWFDIAQVKLSPPGTPRRVAFTPREGPEGARDIFIHDLDRASQTQLTFADGSPSRNRWFPAWSPDGRYVAYSTAADGGWRVLVKGVDGTGNSQELLNEPTVNAVQDWTAHHLLYYTIGDGTGRDLWRLELDDESRAGKRHVVVDTPFNQHDGALSLDGDWLAFASDRTGDYEVYVRPFLGENEYKISQNGGTQPRWRPDGKELFYVEGDTLMAVPVQLGERSLFGEPRPLFSESSLVKTTPTQRSYDNAWDGESFILAVPYEDPKNPPLIRVVLNWYEEFRDREQD